MPNITFELFVILLLLIGNGLLALSEIAIVSARRTRLLQAERGHAGARVAAELSGSPTRFLSTVQVGITLIGVLSVPMAAPRSPRRWPSPSKATPASAPTPRKSPLASSS